jgi:hypothetical protein
VIRLRRSRSRSKSTPSPEMVKKEEFDKFYPTVQFQLGSNGSTCSICLEEIKHKSPVKVLQCLHIFHSKCITEWYLSKASCPLCKHLILQDETMLVRDI